MQEISLGLNNDDMIWFWAFQGFRVKPGYYGRPPEVYGNSFLRPLFSSLAREMIAGILFTLLLPNFLYAENGVIEKSARNVKDFGAKGDGVADDTEAFIEALQSRRSLPYGGKRPVSVYVPSGRYLLSGTLIVWGYTEFFGDWQNPPTLILAPASLAFQDLAHPAPFIVTAGGYQMPENTHDWITRTNDVNGSTNNTFEIIVRDLNIEIGEHNPAAWGLYWWCAQQTALRNVSVNAGTSLGCLNTNGWGGGSTIANCKFNGGQIGYFSDATSMEFFRDCIFTGQTQFAVNINGVAMYTFHRIKFSDAPVLLGPGFRGVINFLQCDFHQSNTIPFIDQFHRSTVHFEDVSFENGSLLAPELRECALDGKVNCWSSKEVTIDGSAVSGSAEMVRESADPLKLPDPDYPRPSAHCVNVQSIGARGDGFHDNTVALSRALTKYSELFFPGGTYLVKAPLIVRPGQRLFGATGAVIRLDRDGSYFGAKLNHGLLEVLGNGRAGVTLCNLSFQNNTPEGSCLEWHGDPSSLVIDCNFLNVGGSPDPSISIEEGGGYFEESWNPAGNGPSAIGVTVHSQEPLWLCSFQAEHYKTSSIQLSGSRRVGLVNIELESSPPSENTFGTEIRIQNSKEVCGYGLGAGNWQKSRAPHLIRLEGNNRIRLWGITAVNVSHLVTDLETGSSKAYGKESTGYQDIDASVLAGFIQTGK